MSTLLVIFVLGYGFHCGYKLIDRGIKALVDLRKSKEVKE